MDFPLRFWDLHQILSISKRKMSLIAEVIPKEVAT